jgi:RHS repeat-associated protein
VRSGLAVLQPTGGDTANTVFPRYPNATGWQYVVPTDTQRFTYDAVGRLLTAKNRAARVTRTYASSGLLASERQQIMTWGGTGADSNYNAHDYTLSYGYDLDSRRTSIQHPSQLLPRDAARTIGSTTSYAYDSKTGNVTTITDLFGQTHRYVYAPRGDVDSVFHSAVAYGSSAPVTEVRSYTLDGDVSSIRVLSPLDSIVVGASFLTYDDSHRLASGFGGTATYSDLGNATYSEMSGLVPNGAGVWPYWYSCESFHYDGLGNTTSSSSVTSIGSPCSTPSDSATYIYQLGTARLDRVKDSTSVLRNSYDSAGNLQFQYSDSLPSSYPGSYSYTDAQDRYTYYGADDRIMASDARWAAVRLAYTSHPYDSLQTAFEEYRYDALGRRVEVRARKYCASGMGMICRTGTIRRTVWDGDQELHEITMPGDDGVSAAELENDTLAVTRSFPYASGGSGDQDPRHLFGRELYVFGQSIDAPVAIIRSNFVTSWTYASANDSSWVFRPRTILPVYGSGGTLVNSYFAENGVTSWGEYEPTMGSGVGMYTTGGGVRLAYGSVVSPTSNYLGTLLVDKRDDVGTFYRRNRSYDPIIGRFTQEDPLGLIGGLNIYAYAGGDPINNTDPSGLTTMQICTQCQSGDDGSQETYEQGPIPHSSAAGGTCTNLMQDDDATGGPRDDSRTDDPECTYHQGSGILICQAPSGETRQAKGYSGQPPYKNDPSAQNLSNQGPIPQGCYTWGPALNGGGNHKNLKGPVIPITPCTGTNTFGRDLFRFHGDDGHGTASTGCIVIGHDFRSWLSGFGHGRLTVVP